MGASHGPARSMRHEILRTALINAIAPYVIYVLCEPELGAFAALALSAVPPAIEGAWSIWRQRRLDVVAMLVLGGIVVEHDWRATWLGP
ncbi:MAG: hypothetical protein SFX73_26275 [Kofleriaceae bacterium]|nr:hypothetical protein [Kofleriaceae bacterium]